MPVEVPHFDYPFRFGQGGHAVCVEQDSDADIRNCVVAILKTPIGARLDLGDFGAPDQVFREGGINTDQLLSVLRRWEDRAEYTMTLQQLVGLAQTVTVNFTGEINA